MRWLARLVVFRRAAARLSCLDGEQEGRLKWCLWRSVPGSWCLVLDTQCLDGLDGWYEVEEG